MKELPHRARQIDRWAGLAIITRGLLMAAHWIIYTVVHGPSSIDQTRALFGHPTLFWSLHLSVDWSEGFKGGKLSILSPRSRCPWSLYPLLIVPRHPVSLLIPPGKNALVPIEIRRRAQLET